MLGRWLLITLFVVSCFCEDMEEFDDMDLPEYLSEEETLELKEKVEEMFYHAYEAYMEHAFPMDEILPLTCRGKNVLGGLALTLVDSVDTLLLMGNHEEYVKQIEWIIDNLDLDKDEDVVTFEFNIRYVGSLLSAHLACSDPELNIMPHYQGQLLEMAQKAADKLMVAFNTATGLPTRKVNLKTGFVEDQPYWVCVADAGSFLLEFGVLSNLTGDPKYIDTAMKSAKYVYDQRSSKNLLGTNLNIGNGQWELKTASTASGVDSYYEYLIKYSILFNDLETKKMFRKLYKAVKKHLKMGPLYYTGNMEDGLVAAPYFYGLQAFWPGMQTLLKDAKQTEEAIEGARTMMGIWQHFGFVPEVLDVPRDFLVDGRYHLRPELAESLYYLYMETGDPLWPLLAKDIVDAIDTVCRVPCGFAAVKDVRKKTLLNQMESFFTAETLKYLYLIFDGRHPPLGKNNTVFNTEAHLLWLPTPSPPEV